MRYFTNKLFAGTLTCSLAIFVNPVFAHSGHDHQKEKPKQFSLTLVAAEGVTTSATGSISRKSQAKGSAKSSRVVHFKAAVSVPLPSTVPAMTDDDTSLAAITLTLSRAGTSYASCTYEFHNIRSDGDDSSELTSATNTAVFRIAIDGKSKAGTVRKVHGKKGGCDTDLATEGIQAGLPDIQTGDVAAVSITNGDATVTQFLTGTF